MSFTISIRQKGPISVVSIGGRLTAFESGGLRDAIQELLKTGRKSIVLNLGELSYLDSSGIGELARAYVAVVKAGGEMKAVGLTQMVEEVLKITHLSQIFPEFPDEQAALQSFPSAPGASRLLQGKE